ncbi:hypothetical protein C1S80_06970 [Mycolicibacterium aubagnense]|nr:hypothetical protein C1S80_06970 [Mycolicibacterium aubagnense]
MWLMTTATGFQLGANENLALAQAISSFQRLILLDNAWTSTADSIEQATDQDQAVLAALVASMLQELEHALVGAAWLQDFVVQRGIGRVRDAALAAAKDLPDGIASVIEDVDAVYGEQFGQFTEDCYRSLSSGLGNQRRALVQELARLLTGETSDGDLFKNILCGISAGMTVGGLIFTAVPPHVTGPIIVGAGAVALGAFKCDLHNLSEKKKWRFT